MDEIASYHIIEDDCDGEASVVEKQVSHAKKRKLVTLESERSSSKDSEAIDAQRMRSRQAAARSRMRQKERQADLESRVIMKDKQISLLEEENFTLKAQVRELERLNSVFASLAHPTSASVALSRPDLFKDILALCNH